MEKVSLEPKKEGLFKGPEFYVVGHSYLNGNTYTPESIAKTTRELEKYTSGRPVVRVLEGDLIQVDETGEPILTHQNFVGLTKKRAAKLRNKHLAATLDEVFEKADGFRQKFPEQRLVLCFEPKTITSYETIRSAIKQLKEHGITDAYFDSFFGDKLDNVNDANRELETSYPTSWHLLANFGDKKIGLPFNSPGKYDLLTVPYTNSFGTLASESQPVIYGAVGKPETLERISRDPSVKGAYVRFKEGSGLLGTIRMIYNSMTNTENLRKNFILANQVVAG